MRKIAFLALVALCVSCKTYVPQTSLVQNKAQVNVLLDSWHKAAADAKFDAYFEMMGNDGIFIGTDPTENWNREQFKAFAKPYFDKGKAWSFTAVERNIFFSDDGKTAWFDELLDTQMKICRGSGVVQLKNGQWKIVHYVLSMAIPNDKVDEVVRLKTDFDNAILQKLKK